MDAQDANPEMPKRPAPPIQGGHPDLPQLPQGLRPGLSCRTPAGVPCRFPGLTPWAVLLDPCGVPFRFPGLAPWAFLPDPCGVLFRFPGLTPWAFLPDPCGVLLSFPELVRFLTAYETIELQCQVCPAAGAWRCRPKPPLPAMADYLKNARRRRAICL